MDHSSRFLNVGFLGTLGVLLLFTGCASKNLNKRVSAVEAQIGAITDELVRLDQDLQDTRGALQGVQERRGGIPSEAAGGIYRTPSGFQLPSTNIQQALKSAGYYQGNVDGKIGAETKRAIEAFQQDHDLKPDGVVGQRTWSKLKVYLGETVK